jgi:hypothetical protein
MVVHEYLRIFVFQKQMITYEYFMDEMKDWEIDLLADCINSALSEQWEMTRWQMYCIIKPYLKKTQREKTPRDLFPLPNDKPDDNTQTDIEINDFQISELRKRASYVQDMMSNKKT